MAPGAIKAQDGMIKKKLWHPRCAFLARTRRRVVYLPRGRFSAGGGFPHDWLVRAINGKGTFALLEVPEQCDRVRTRASTAERRCSWTPTTARPSQRLRKSARVTLSLTRCFCLFDFQAEQGFWLSLEWVPSAATEVVRLHPVAFHHLEHVFGECTVDLMASCKKTQHGYTRATGDRRRLPFISWYNCEGLAGVDILRQNRSGHPRTGFSGLRVRPLWSRRIWYNTWQGTRGRSSFYPA